MMKLSLISGWPVFRPKTGECCGGICVNNRRYSGIDDQLALGDRPSFAPVFVYLSIRGREVDWLGSTRVKRAWGYLYRDKQVIAVTGFDIEPPAPIRAFRIGLENGEAFQGNATVICEPSALIENRCHPGTTVIVTSELGEMVGHLND